MNRHIVVRKLKQLAPIVASQGITLEGLSPRELNDLMVCLHHIDDRITRAERKARQPWRHGGMFR